MIITSGKVPLEKTIRRQVFPQAPSPTMTSLRRISAIVIFFCLKQHMVSAISGKGSPGSSKAKWEIQDL